MSMDWLRAPVAGRFWCSRFFRTQAAQGFTSGSRRELFSIQPSTAAGSTSGAVSRDGLRILAITAEASEELKTQVLTDWTTLLPGGQLTANVMVPNPSARLWAGYNRSTI